MSTGFTPKSVGPKAATHNRVPIFEDGLVITRDGETLQQLVCDDGGEGFREDIDWIPKRNDD